QQSADEQVAFEKLDFIHAGPPHECGGWGRAAPVDRFWQLRSIAAMPRQADHRGIAGRKRFLVMAESTPASFCPSHRDCADAVCVWMNS
ncbi:MAG TPA: hypothetical protein PK867_11755, partial [Pirellulales bacterium]|nr:hypothetical protein [Pirellulales bacterium]